MDIDALIEPLTGTDDGCGPDLREDADGQPLYHRLRDARSRARDEERQQEIDESPSAHPAAGWHDVMALGQQALAEHSKDLEVACWLGEAALRFDGLAGLDAGARLLAALCDRFWDGVHPRLDVEEGLAARAAPLEGLSGSAKGALLQPLRQVALFHRTGAQAVTLYDWEQAERISRMDATAREAKLAAGAVDVDRLSREAAADRTLLLHSGRDAVAALAVWRALEDTVGQRFGSDAPSLRQVRTLLERIVEVIGRLGGLPAAAGPDGGAAAGHAAADIVASPSFATPAGPAGAPFAIAAAPAAGVMTRESALAELDRIADFFRRTEPHSPLAATLAEVARRGRMSWTDLLAEVMPSAEARADLRMRLGLRPDDDMPAAADA